MPIQIEDDINQIKDKLENLERLLAANRQSWLFGAGISCESNLPLMAKLTELVFDSIHDDDKQILQHLRQELGEDANIEDILSYLGDIISIQGRRRDPNYRLNGIDKTKSELETLHFNVTASIGNIIRWGYSTNDNQDVLGSHNEPLVDIVNHQEFINSLFRLRANLESKRLPVNFFTTNYDTLVEDALALEGLKYWDGFHGGAIAFKELRFGDSIPKSKFQANVIKLHGSIDWYEGDDGNIWRVRDHDKYPNKKK